MKKKIMSVALIVLTLGSFTGFARKAESPENRCKSKSEKVEKVGKREFSRDSKERNLFEGIELTGDQQAQLLNLRQREKNERMARRIESKETGRDSISFIDRRAQRMEYLREVKEIIGPDQYTIFLENMVVNGNGNRPKEMKAAQRNRENIEARMTKGDGRKISRVKFIEK